MKPATLSPDEKAALILARFPRAERLVTGRHSVADDDLIEVLYSEAHAKGQPVRQLSEPMAVTEADVS